MAKHLIMDHTGHTTIDFDSADKVSLDEAEKRFRELTGKGFRAARIDETGKPGQLIKAFDPTVEQTLFIPALQGG